MKERRLLEGVTPQELEALWREARRRGLSRRQFLALLSVGGVGAVLAACVPPPTPTPTPVPPTPTPTPEELAFFAKDTTPFIQHPTNLETRLELLKGFLVPASLFFVRNRSASPRLNAETYRLRIEGDAVERPLELTYDDILRLPSKSIIAYLECAGNWRGFFDRVQGQKAKGTQWLTGAVGTAVWTGVPLGEVLERAGVKRSAVDVNFIGLDEVAFQKPLPIEKALHPDTLLVYAMNGEPLPPDHGFPIRVLVPGWLGSFSVKWVGRIVVSSQKIWVKSNTSSYVLIGPDWPPEEYAPAKGFVLTVQNVKSALALPWPARLSAGPQVVRGYAHAPTGIARVEWSADGGRTWQEARLLEPTLPLAWVRFEFTWDAPRGSHTLMVRATDKAGNTQPRRVPFNEKGYLFNAILPHPVEVV